MQETAQVSFRYIDIRQVFSFVLLALLPKLLARFLQSHASFRLGFHVFNLLVGASMIIKFGQRQCLLMLLTCLGLQLLSNVQLFEKFTIGSLLRASNPNSCH